MSVKHHNSCATQQPSEPENTCDCKAGSSLAAPSGSVTPDALIVAFVQGAQYWEYLRAGCTMWSDDRDMMERAAIERLSNGTLGKSPNA